MKILRLFLHHFKAGFTIIILMVNSILFAQPEYNAGLRFYNKYDFPSGYEYSSLDISWSDPIPVEDELILSFDFSLRNAKPFGFFFHLKGDSLPHSMLANVDFKSPDTTYLEFGFRDEGDVISYPIPKEKIHPLKWFHVSVTYNFIYDEILVLLDEERIGSFKYPMLNNQNIYLQFGYLQTIHDVPSMTVKNIRIQDINGLKHHWTLNEYEGDGAYDQIGGRISKTTNTQWGYASHTNWVSYDTLELDMWSKVTMEKTKSELFIINNQLRKFKVEEHGNSELYLDVNIPIQEKHVFFYNPLTHFLYGFHGGRNEYISVDLDGQKVESYPAADPNVDQYYEAGKFYDIETNDMYWIGGYGWYTAKNHIQKFDFTHNKWDTLAIWGDQFYPRFGSAVSEGPNPNSIYIFGGTGNSSGMQERGWETFTGLWEFNRQTLEMRRLFDFEFMPDYSEAIMAYSRNLNQFIIAHNKATQSPVTVSTVDAQSGQVEYHANIPGTVGRKIGRNLPPIIGRETGKLIIPTFKRGARDDDKIDIHIHTINYPPMHPLTVTFFAEWGRILLGGSGLFIAIVIIVFQYRRNNNHQQSISPVIALPQFLPEEDPYLQSEFAIQCFGNFKLYQGGKEISMNEWRSKKARALLVFILMKNKQGVTPHEITNTFWPDSSEQSARNSRYVAMSQIRSILGEAGSILNIKDHNVVVDLPEGYFSDIHYLNRVIAANAHADIQSRETVLRLMGNGQICHDIDAIWMDEIRRNILADGKRIASSLSTHYMELEAWKKLSELGHQILHWEMIEEEGLLWAVKGLVAEGHTAKAKSTFDHYTQHYERIIEEPFCDSFQAYLNKNI